MPSVWEGASLLWGRSMTEAESERLSRNLAEVIDSVPIASTRRHAITSGSSNLASAGPPRHVACGGETRHDRERLR